MRAGNDWLELLHAGRADFTLAWRRLADAADGDEARAARAVPRPRAPDAWLARWRERCAREDAGPADGAEAAPEARAARMRRVNPMVIPRNHRVEEALAAASDDDDLGPFERLLEALRRPYDEIAEHAALRRAGAGRGHGLLPDLLRHLKDRARGSGPKPRPHQLLRSSRSLTNTVFGSGLLGQLGEGRAQRRDHARAAAGAGRC